MIETATGTASNIGENSYFLSQKYFSGEVRVDNIEKTHSPHIPTSEKLEVIEVDGQSIVQFNESINNLNYEDQSGDLYACLKDFHTPMVTSPRDSIKFARLSNQSNDTLPYGLFRFLKDKKFNLSQATALCRLVFARRHGLDINPMIAMTNGWNSQPFQTFLKEGTSFKTNGIDYFSSPPISTFSKTILRDYYMFQKNIDRRLSLSNSIRDIYKASTIYNHLIWVQGPPDDIQVYKDFMNLYSSQQDEIFPHGRNIFAAQKGSPTNKREVNFGSQGLLEWAQENKRGKDWLFAPRYPHKVKDRIHFSPYGLFELAERAAQATVYVDKYGEFQPVWIEKVSFGSNYVDLVLNKPRQTLGKIDVTDKFGDVFNYGFNLRKVSDNNYTELDITVNLVNETTIRINSIYENLTGKNIEVSYAATGGVIKPKGSIQNPSFQGCLGSIIMKGVESPSWINKPTLDHHLCAFRKVFYL